MASLSALVLVVCCGPHAGSAASAQDPGVPGAAPSSAATPSGQPTPAGDMIKRFHQTVTERAPWAAVLVDPANPVALELAAATLPGVPDDATAITTGTPTLADSAQGPGGAAAMSGWRADAGVVVRAVAACQDPGAGFDAVDERAALVSAGAEPRRAAAAMPALKGQIAQVISTAGGTSGCLSQGTLADLAQALDVPVPTSTITTTGADQ